VVDLAVPLPRRGYVGLLVAPISEPGALEPGLYVRSVAVGSSAEHAGARAGDRLLALGEHPATDMNSVRKVLRGLSAGDALAISVLRAGRVIELRESVRSYPLEQHAYGRVVLEQVQVGEHRLRAIVVLPDCAGPHPVVYYLPGAHWASEEYPFTPEHPVPALLGQLARAGIASLRVERFGMGDSEGPPCNDVDFDTEYSGYRAGLGLLETAPWCDRGRVALFGHSLGAMVAPLLATDSSVRFDPRAVVTFGASAIPISSGLATALRRFSSRQPNVAPETVLLQCELVRLIVTGKLTVQQALLQRPDLREVTPPHFTDDTIYRRTVRFYHQLEQQPLDDAWRKVTVPVLAIHGSHDWICAPEDSQHIAAITPLGEFRAVQRVDHQLAAVEKEEVDLASEGPAEHAGRPMMQPRTEVQTLAPSLAELVTGYLGKALA
jgi:uncharacterized protein